MITIGENKGNKVYESGVIVLWRLNREVSFRGQTQDHFSESFTFSFKRVNLKVINDTKIIIDIIIM